jgi:hypothetical protein
MLAHLRTLPNHLTFRMSVIKGDLDMVHFQEWKPFLDRGLDSIC